MTAITRRTVLSSSALLVTVSAAGCGGQEQPAEADDNQSPDDTLTLTSSAFEDGEQIPTRYGYEADNVNPPLTISNVPDDAASLALIVDDPDAVEPAGTVWDHWVVWNIPVDQTSIPADWTPATATEGTNDYGAVGYGGPNPPETAHEYRFRLFALDTTLDRPTETDADALETAMEGHIIVQTQLTGTYPA